MNKDEGSQYVWLDLNSNQYVDWDTAVKLNGGNDPSKSNQIVRTDKPLNYIGKSGQEMAALEEQAARNDIDRSAGVDVSGPSLDEVTGKQSSPNTNVVSQSNSNTTSDPNAQPVSGDAQIIARSIYSPQNSGALPKWLPDNASKDDYVKALDKFSYQERIELKRRLWAGGFYGEDALKTLGPPEDANIDDDFKKAWETLLTDTAKRNKDTSNPTAKTSLDDLLLSRIEANATTIRNATIEQYRPTQLVTALNDWGIKNIGRELSETETQELLKLTFSSDLNAARGEIGVEKSRKFGDSSGDAFASGRLVHGGGPDSSAISYGKQLANLYSVQVVQDFTGDPSKAPDPAFAKGLGISVAGNANQLLAMHEWARSQQGDGKLFKEVHAEYSPNSSEPNSITLIFNDGAEKPTISGGDSMFGFSRGDDLSLFMDGVRRPGSFAAYNWEGENGKRGAYGLSDQIWNYYAGQVGIDSNDHSITAQDRVARAYFQDKFAEYNNWQDVAMAVRVNENVAKRRNMLRSRDGAGFIDTETPIEDVSWANNAIASMASNRRRFVVNAPTPGDAYSQMFGESGNDIPYISDPYAGRPIDYQAGEDKLLYLAKSKYGNRANAENALASTLKIMGGSAYGGN